MNLSDKRKKFLKEVAFAFFFGLIVACLAYAASQTVLYWPFLRIQNGIDDSMFRLRHNLQSESERDIESIIIVDLDDKTSASIGRFSSKRWPRSHLAKVIGNLKHDGARLIYFDLLLQDWTRDNTELADSSRAAGNVIAGYYFRLDSRNKKRRPLDQVYNDQLSTSLLSKEKIDRNRFIKAWDIVFPYYELVKSVSALGFANYIPDPDGILRHIPLYIASGKNGRTVSPSASLQMWLKLNDIHYSETDISPKGIRFGETFIPTDKHCFMRLNYNTTGYVYPYVSFVDVLDGNFEPGTFDGKVIMIGSSSENIGDLKKIPGGNILPGVEIHATALSTLISQNFISVLSGNIIFLVCMVCGIASGLIFNFVHPLKAGLPIVLVVPVGFYLTAVYSFLRHATLVNVSLPVFVVGLLYVVITIHRFMDHFEKKQIG